MKNPRRLHITKTSLWRHAYELKEDGNTLATLTLHSRSGSHASGAGESFDITLQRTRLIPKEIELHRGGGALSTFYSQWNAKGWIELHGKKYVWIPVNATWSAWAWKDEKGEEIMRLSYNPFRPFTISGKIHAHPDVSSQELQELGLLGWYLLLLDFELTGTRIFHTLNSLFRRFKGSVAA